MKFRYIVIILFLVYTSCMLPSHPEANIEEFATNFENLESDILFRNTDSLLLLDKSNLQHNGIEIPESITNLSYLQWSYNGESLYFTTLFDGDNSLLKKYSLADQAFYSVSDIHCWSFSVSDLRGWMFYSVKQAGSYQTTNYFYDIENEIVLEIDSFIFNIFENDSTRINNIYYGNIGWTYDNNLYVDFRLSYTHFDSSYSSAWKTVVLEYKSNSFVILKEFNFEGLRLFFNHDSSFAYFTNSNSWDYHQIGTFLVDANQADTIKLSSSTLAYPKFLKNSNKLIYKKKTSGTISHWDENYWLYYLESGEETNIFPEANDILGFSISTTEEQVVCSARLWGGDYDYYMFVMNIDGSNAAVLYDLEDGWGNNMVLFRPSLDTLGF